MKNLIEQSLDPLVSSYFKNQGQQRTLIELIQERSEIQEVATKDMKTRFAEYDLGLQEVLIGTPHSHDRRHSDRNDLEPASRAAGRGRAERDL